MIIKVVDTYRRVLASTTKGRYLGNFTRDEVAEILVHLRRRVCSDQDIEGNDIEGSEHLQQDLERKIWNGNFCER